MTSVNTSPNFVVNPWAVQTQWNPWNPWGQATTDADQQVVQWNPWNPWNPWGQTTEQTQMWVWNPWNPWAPFTMLNENDDAEDEAEDDDAV